VTHMGRHVTCRYHGVGNGIEDGCVDNAPTLQRRSPAGHIGKQDPAGKGPKRLAASPRKHNTTYRAGHPQQPDNEVKHSAKHHCTKQTGQQAQHTHNMKPSRAQTITAPRPSARHHNQHQPPSTAGTPSARNNTHQQIMHTLMWNPS
jgi:hypothetical protein